MIEFYNNNNNNNNNNNYEKMVQDTDFLQSTHPCNGRSGKLCYKCFCDPQVASYATAYTKCRHCTDLMFIHKHRVYIFNKWVKLK
jgi:hypothetical protein